MKMNPIKLSHLLEIVKEAHEKGEWWIDSTGEISHEKIKSSNLALKDGYKHMKSSENKIEILTWSLQPEDLNIIILGIEKIIKINSIENDPDMEVGKDGYIGPRIDILVKKKNKQFKNIPFEILKNRLPSWLKNYDKGKILNSKNTMNENKSFHHYHKEYRLYEGDRHIVAMFNDGSRLMFEIHFRNNHGKDRDTWRRRALTCWKSIANEIHRNVQLTEVGNPVQKTWKESFQEALKHPKLKEYIRQSHHQKVFDDAGYPAEVQGKPAPCIDAVNFTHQG